MYIYDGSICQKGNNIVKEKVLLKLELELSPTKRDKYKPGFFSGHVGGIYITRILTVIDLNLQVIIVIHRLYEFCLGCLAMEKLLNHYDKECMKMAMLKHEETFREQVYELHRLYRIQKMLMKDIAKKRPDPHYESNYNQPEARQRPGLERPIEAFNYQESGGKFRVSEIEDDQSDLELTLGPRSYYHKKIKAADPALQSDSGPSFSSSSTGSSHIKGARITAKDEFLSQQKWGPERPPVVSNQDRLKSPPWLFQALSLNMT